MTFLYLTEQGAVLKKTGQRLIVEKDDQKLLDIPAAKIEGVMIFGNVQFTTQAVQLLLRKGVELALFSRSGRLLGQLTDPATKNIDLRKAQFKRHGEKDFVEALARRLVDAKLANCLEFVKQFGHNHPDTALDEETEELEALRPHVDRAMELSTLLGLEGSAARVYFQAFAKMIRHGFSFTGRRRRPATDPVNALLSLGYTMVYNEIASLLDGMGFDPYLGYYHQPRYGHATLASDLLEEFRTPLVDRFTLKIINNRVFQESDFYLHQPSGAYYLTDAARKQYFADYEQFISQPTACAKDETETTFRRLFRRQAERLKKAVIDNTMYQPFIFKW
ncbi:Cas1: CRISPR-associated endonuclease, Cas1 [Desulfosarcina variabilis str. Montpellier]|uniref:CRISPR-associated endonuclease Cas1 n=1 Tax=Desulfosarcina variabilis TaxID=2300 RepID=UPI003AFAE4F9